MLSFAQAQEYLYRANIYGVRPGLQRITELLSRLGNPQLHGKVIHIGGTNGKGSVSSYCAHVAAAADLKCGWYTSPYLENFTERMRILDGRRGLERFEQDFRSPEIPESRFAELMEDLIPVIEGMVRDGFEHPTVFEIETAIAFLWFKEENCEILVIEVGLGGRLDSTNVFPHPLAVIITALSYDHMERLGNRLSDIAFEKAGIIKAKSPVFLYDPKVAVNDPEEAMAAVRVITERCESLQAPLELISYKNLSSAERDENGQSFVLPPLKQACRINLSGRYQLLNAALAVKACRLFADDEAIYEGLRRAVWPGRLESLRQSPLILIDGSHNIQGCESLSQELKLRLSGAPAVILTGMLGDKEHKEMLSAVLASHSVRPVLVVSSDPPVPRALPAADLAREVAEILGTNSESIVKLAPYLSQAFHDGIRRKVELAVEDTYNEAVIAHDRDYRRAAQYAYEMATALDLPLIAFGSLYLVGNLRPIIRRLVNAPKQNLTGLDD